MVQKKNDTLIIGNPSGGSPEAFLRKFLDVVYPLSSSLCLISGDLPSRFRDKIAWIKVDYYLKNNNKILNKIINYAIFNIIVLLKVIIVLRENDINIVIFLVVLPLPMIAVKLFGKKIVLHRGSSFSKERGLRKNTINGYILNKIFEDFPCSISDKLILELENSLNFQGIEKYEQKVKYCQLYIDVDRFRCKKKFTNRQMKLGVIGALTTNKGVDKFCEAIISIKDYIYKNDIKITIIGDGPLLHSLIKRVDSELLQDRVTFTGWIQHDSLIDYLNEFKLIVLPSFSEGTSYITLEAMACNTPVLATPVGGIPNIISDEVTGFIMEDNSPICIAKNIKRALEFADLDAVSKNARALIVKNFSYESAIDSYAKMFNELLKE